MSFYKRHAPRHREHTRPLPDFGELEGMRALKEEKEIPLRQWQQEVRRGKEFGLDCVDSIEDKSEISCLRWASVRGDKVWSLARVPISIAFTISARPEAVRSMITRRRSSLFFTIEINFRALSRRITPTIEAVSRPTDRPS